MSTYRLHPIDETSRARLAEQGLTLSLVDGLDDSESGVARYDAWTQADGRGFYLDRAADGSEDDGLLDPDAVVDSVTAF